MNTVQKFLWIMLMGCLSFGSSAKKISTEKLSDFPFKIKQWQTQQGLSVRYVFLKDIPLLDAYLVFDAGSARDAHLPGVAYLTNQMLDQGGSGMDSKTLADKFAQLGTIYQHSVDRDRAQLGIRSLLEQSEKSIDLLSHMLSEVNFPKKSFEQIRSIQLASLAYSKQNPADLAEDQLYQNIYEQHPYGHAVLGDRAHVIALTHSDLKRFYTSYYSASNGQLVIVGALNEADAHRYADRISQALSGAPVPKALPKLRETNSWSGVAKKHHLPFPATQTQIRLAHLVSIDRKNPDYYALLIANHILGGGGLGSLLMEGIRENAGLAYAVYSQIDLMRDEGLFKISLATRQSQADRALALVQTIIEDYVKEGPSERSLFEAKQHLIGRFPLYFDSNKAIAMQVLHLAYADLPEHLARYRTKISTVSLEEVQRVLRKYILPQALSIVTVG